MRRIGVVVLCWAAFLLTVAGHAQGQVLHAWYDVNLSTGIWEGRTDQYDDEHLVDVRDTGVGSGDHRGGSYGTNVETWAQFDDKGGDFWPDRIGGFTGMQNGMTTWEVRNAAGWDDRDGWVNENGDAGIGNNNNGYTISMALNIYEVTSYEGVWDGNPNGPNDDTPILNGSTAAFNEGASIDPEPGKALLWLDAERDDVGGPVWVMDAGAEMVAGPVTFNQWQVHSFVYNGEVSEHYIDGTLVGSGNAGNSPMANLAFWSTDGGWHRAGNLDFAEGLFYDGVLSASDRVETEQYLSEKWGIGTRPACDFDMGGGCDLDDINQLMNDAETGGTSTDMNGDDVVNDADRDLWLASAGPENGFAGPFLVGDSDLNGTVEASDLNNMALAWLNESQFNWSNGNFTIAGGPGVRVNDLNGIGLNWQASTAMAAANSSVPEPASIVLVLAGLIGLFVVRRR